MDQVIYLKILIVSFLIIKFFDNLISADKLFEKALQRFKTCLLVNNNNLCGNLASLSPIILDDNLKTTSFSFFIADLNLLICEFDSIALHLNNCIASFYTDKN